MRFQVPAILSSGVTVLLGAIAAATTRVRIQTGVSVLSILDPGVSSTGAGSHHAAEVVRRRSARVATVDWSPYLFV